MSQSTDRKEKDPLAYNPKPERLETSKTIIQQILVVPTHQSCQLISETIKQSTSAQSNNQINGISKVSSTNQAPIDASLSPEQKKSTEEIDEQIKMLDARIDDLRQETQRNSRFIKTMVRSKKRWEEKIKALQQKTDTQMDDILVLQDRFSDILKEGYFDKPSGAIDWEWNSDYLAQFFQDTGSDEDDKVGDDDDVSDDDDVEIIENEQIYSKSIETHNSKGNTCTRI